MKDSAQSCRTPLFLLLTLFFLLTAASPPASAQDEPTIAKNSVLVTLEQHQHGPGGRGDTPPAWTPGIGYRVNGPIASGSRFWVEFSIPDRKQRLTADCGITVEIEKGKRWETGCHAGTVEESVRFTGLVDFAIHMSNELLGTNIVLFQGKAKVAKTPPKWPQDKLSFEYYVDEDWRVPIGYLWRGRTLNIQMWFHGRPGEARPYLFYQGKQVAKGENCGGANFEPASYVWWPVDCEFFGEGSEDVVEKLSKAPGEYEIKVLQEGRLTRTAKFTVAEDGSFDNGIASANKLGSDTVIVPFKVLVDLAPWDKLAWKTGAFYGNPLTGFTAPQ